MREAVEICLRREPLRRKLLRPFVVSNLGLLAGKRAEAERGETLDPASHRK